MSNLDELIENKKKSDKKQRIISMIFTSISLIILFVIFMLIKNTKEDNLELGNKLVTKNKITDSLENRLNTISNAFKSDIIECIGVPTMRKTVTGLPLYDFTMCITDSITILSLKKVEYFFADDTYNPKLKISENASQKFSIIITNSWGCMNIVPVYLHYKNNNVDTINFPMCDKAKLKLPEL
jgi:hypothetical protein